MAGFAEGAPCWAVVMLPDLAAGKRFYGELLGWTFGESVPERESYTPALLEGADAAALMPKPDGRMPTAWGLYLATSDIRATSAKVREAGGQVIMEPFPVGEAGRTAVVADPGGAVFQLWEAGTRSGFGVTGRPGAYAWAEVLTRDPQAVDAFYTEVFGFGGTDLTDSLGDDFLMWTPKGEPADEEHAIGGRSLLDERYPEQMPAHFLTYFAVADCDEAARVTTRLGGRTLLGPEDSPYGRYAVLVDNQGASFAVIGHTG